jgi:hypothetical protein
LDEKELCVVEPVDRLRDEILGFTCRLVTEPSTAGKEASVLKVMEAELIKLSKL